MVLLVFYLKWAPFFCAILYILFRLTLFKKILFGPTNDQPWIWFCNYGLANLFFYWSWEYNDQWRIGVLIAAVSAIVFLSAGQIFASIRRLGGEGRLLSGILPLLLFFLLNLPITTLIVWRKAQGLPLS